MAKIGNAVVFISAHTKGLNKALGDAQRKTRATIGNIQGALTGMGRKMTVVGGAIMGGFMYAAKGAADFDKAMREVNTMMGISEREFQTLSLDVREMSKDLGVGAVESAQALYQAISAGVPKENAIDFLRVATKAAIAGVTDTKTSVDGLTSVMNAFKIPMKDANRVADIMFTTVKNGKTTFAELSASLYNVAPLAAGAGIEFDEVAAAIATLTKQGVPTAQATTQIRAAIQGLIKPNKEMTKTLKELNVESGTALIKKRGLQGAIMAVAEASGNENAAQEKIKEQYVQTAKKLGEYQKQLQTVGGDKAGVIKKISETQEKLQGLSKKYQAAAKAGVEGAAIQFKSIEALGAVLGMTGESAQMAAEDVDAMKNSAGAANDAYTEMEKSASRQYEKMVKQLGDLRIEIGTQVIPVLLELGKRVTPIIKAFAGWVKENKDLTLKLAGIGAVLVVGGPIMMGMSSMLGLIVHLATATKVLAGAKCLGFLMGTPGAAIGLWGLFGVLTAIVGAAGVGWMIGTWINKAIDEWFPSLAKGIDWIFDKFVALIGKIKEWMGLDREVSEASTKHGGSLEDVIAKRKAMQDSGELDSLDSLDKLATGGPARAGVPYMVGERGRELMLPRMGGEVLNNATTERLLGALGGLKGGGQRPIQININGVNQSPMAIAAAVNRKVRMAT